MKAQSIQQGYGSLLWMSKDFMNMNKIAASACTSISEFYVYQMFKILKQFSRGKILSWILLLVYNMQMLGLIYQPDMVAKLAENQFNSDRKIAVAGQFVAYFRLFPSYGNLLSSQYFSSTATAFEREREFVLAASALNSGLLLYIIIRFLYYMLV